MTARLADEARHPGLAADIAKLIADDRADGLPTLSNLGQNVIAYYPTGAGHVFVRRDITANVFTARCDCGWSESREYDSTSPLGDFYDVRDEVRQLAAEHAEACSRPAGSGERR